MYCTAFTMLRVEMFHLLSHTYGRRGMGKWMHALLHVCSICEGK